MAHGSLRERGRCWRPKGEDDIRRSLDQDLLGRSTLTCVQIAVEVFGAPAANIARGLAAGFERDDLTDADAVDADLRAWAPSGTRREANRPSSEHGADTGPRAAFLPTRALLVRRAARQRRRARALRARRWRARGAGGCDRHDVRQRHPALDATRDTTAFAHDGHGSCHKRAIAETSSNLPQAAFHGRPGCVEPSLVSAFDTSSRTCPSPRPDTTTDGP